MGIVTDTIAEQHQKEIDEYKSALYKLFNAANGVIREWDKSKRGRQVHSVDLRTYMHELDEVLTGLRNHPLIGGK